MTKTRLPKYVTIEDTNISLELKLINNKMVYSGICYIIKDVDVTEDEILITCDDPYNSHLKGKRLYSTSKEVFNSNRDMNDNKVLQSLVDYHSNNPDQLEQNKPKIRPLTKEDGYIINTFEDDKGNYSPAFTTIKESEYLKKEKVIRIIYQGDVPSEKDIAKFVNTTYPKMKLGKARSMRIYKDEPWHFTDQGSAYGVILVILKKKN